MVLCFFFALLEAAVVFRFAGVLFAGVDFDALCFGVVLLGGLLSAGVDDWDWAAAGGKKPSPSSKKIPAKPETAKRRTQTLPTAESWHP